MVITSHSLRAKGCQCRGRIGQDPELCRYLVLPEEIRRQRFAARASLHAGCAIADFKRQRDVRVPVDHETLAVMKIDPGKEEAELGLALERPGRVPGEHIEPFLAERLEALAGRDRDELNLVRRAECRRSERATEVDIEAAPLAVRSSFGKADQPRADAADQVSALFLRPQACLLKRRTIPG
jgi:hypothetical protein